MIDSIRNSCGQSMARAMLLPTAILLLAGCQAEKKEDASAKAAGELLLWVMPNTPKPEKDMIDLLEPFKADHPGVDIKISVLDWGSAWTKLTTAAIAGDGPDVVQLGTTWTPFLSGMKVLLPLDDLDRELNVKETFLPATWAAAKPRTSDQVTSLPWFIDVRPIFYRTDVFAEAKVDPKGVANWDDYLAALKKIQAAGIRTNGEVVAPVGFPGKNDWNVVHNFAPWIWSAGGDFLNDKGDKCVLGSEESIQGILFYLGLVRQGLNPKTNMEKNTAQVSADFDAGRLATIFETTLKESSLNQAASQGGAAQTHVAENYGVMVPPKGPSERAVFMGGSHLAIFKSSKNQALAKELLRYLCADTAAQLAHAQVSGFLPALKKTFDNPYFTRDRKRSVFKEIVQYGRVYPSVPYWGEIETSVLVKRLGNLFDIAAEVSGPFSESAVRKEVAEAVKDVDALIQAHFQTHPEDRVTLAKYQAE